MTSVAIGALRVKNMSRQVSRRQNAIKDMVAVAAERAPKMVEKYSKTRVKWPLKNRQDKGLNDK